MHSLYYLSKQSRLNNCVQHSEMHGHKKRTSISTFPLIAKLLGGRTVLVSLECEILKSLGSS